MPDTCMRICSSAYGHIQIYQHWRDGIKEKKTKAKAKSYIMWNLYTILCVKRSYAHTNSQAHRDTDTLANSYTCEAKTMPEYLIAKRKE